MMNRFVLSGAFGLALLLTMPSTHTFRAGTFGPAAALAQEEGHGGGGSGSGGGGSGGGGGHESGGSHESGGGCSGGGCGGGGGSGESGGGKQYRGERGGPPVNCPFGDKSGRGRYATQRSGHNTGHEGGEQEGTTEQEAGSTVINRSGITGGGPSGESFVCDSPGNWSTGSKIFRH